MIESAKSQNAMVLLIGIRLPPNYGASYSDAFGAVFPHLAERHHLPLVPFLLKNVAEHEELMQTDRHHPTARAQPLILDNVWPKLLQLLRTLPCPIAPMLFLTPLRNSMSNWLLRIGGEF